MQLAGDLLDEAELLTNKAEQDAQSMNVRMYTVADDGRVTLVDDLNREYKFVYSCFCTS